MLDIAVITAPRAKNYLPSTLASIKDSWDIDPWVCGEIGTKIPENVSEFILNPGPRGIFYNWFFAAENLLEVSDEPYIMICEDDIQFTTSASYHIRRVLQMRRVAGLKKERIGCYSPYCSQTNEPKMPFENHFDWVIPYIPRHYWAGNLCMIFPREFLAKMVDAKDQIESFAKEQSPTGGPDHVDYAIGKYIIDVAKSEIITHSPSLIKHIGEVSCNPSNDTHVNRNNPVRKGAGVP